MPLPLKDRKIGAVEYILKKMKGSDSYDKMKDDNEYGSEKLMMRSEPESDYQIGMKQAVSEMMSAVESKNAESFEKGLRGFISMMLDANEDEKKLEKENE
jgi:hypothetical protein